MNISYSSSTLRIGYEIDMRTKNLNVNQNLFIDYRISYKYRIRLIFNDIDLNEDLFTNKINLRARIYYISNSNDQLFFTLAKNLKTLGYVKKLDNYEYELVLAKRKNIQLDTAIRINLSDFFTIKLGVTNVLSNNREFYIRPRFMFYVK